MKGNEVLKHVLVKMTYPMQIYIRKSINAVNQSRYKYALMNTFTCNSNVYLV